MQIKLFLLLFFFGGLVGNTVAHPDTKDSVSVYIFLHDACVISQNYTLMLNELAATFSSDELSFVGVFPDFSSKPDKIEAFREKYKITFPLKTDYFKTLTQKMGATITPEVVVFDHQQEEILYKGRIDNSYFRVGKRRTVTTTSELEDALRAITNGEPVAVKETPAIGCIISMRTPSN